MGNTNHGWALNVSYALLLTPLTQSYESIFQISKLENSNASLNHKRCYNCTSTLRASPIGCELLNASN